MTGVLLINMGGAENPVELKQFLRLMFLDKHILPLPYIMRKFLSVYISSTRYKNSWKRYELAGGSPLKKNTELLADLLQEKFGSEYSVKFAFSYSNPLIVDSIKDFLKKNITNITVLPLYPQPGISTTDSVKSDIEKIKKKYNQLQFKIVPAFYKHPAFISFWSDLIRKHIHNNELKHPTLLFSAHSIPLKLLNKGDVYPSAIMLSAKLIADSIVLPYFISYQSGMSDKTWLGPDTTDTLKSLISEGKKEIVIIPISFISENLETLYDLDVDIIPEILKETKIHVSRIKIPEAHPGFLSMLEKIVKENN